MAEKLHVAIVGLGLIGASAGLALRRYQDKVTVVGHDPNNEFASKAKRAGAVDRTEWNLINTVAPADRVILALPVGEIRDTLNAIKEDLRPGCMVMDTAEVKASVMQWAAELLPPEVHFVGGHPIVLSETLEPDGARADLFQGKLFCLTPSSSTDAKAVQLAADVAEALGAKPYFLSAEEHDGLAAGVEQLPMLLAAALMSVTSSSSAWKDMRKLAANQYFASTLLTSPSSKEATATAQANRENAIHWLDAMVNELTAYRDQLASGETDEMAKRVDLGLAATYSWLNASYTGNWDSDANPMAEVPTTGSSLRDMFFGRLRMPDRAKQAEQGKRK
jgi:prephenate dehydrogenase